MKRPFGLPSSLELGTVHLPRFERLLLPVLYVSLNTSKLHELSTLSEVVTTVTITQVVVLIFFAGSFL